MSENRAATDLTNNDPAVEVEAAAYGITNSLHHHDEPGFLMESVASTAKARGVRGFNARDLGSMLFEHFTKPSVRDEIAKFCGPGRQFALVPVELTDHSDGGNAVFSSEIQKAIPPRIMAGLDKLKLKFDIVPQRPSLASLEDKSHQTFTC